MAARRDYYVVLGVPPDADSTAIKNAFRQLARRYHPDISTEPDAEQRFREMPSPVPGGPPGGAYVIIRTGAAPRAPGQPTRAACPRNRTDRGVCWSPFLRAAGESRAESPRCTGPQPLSGATKCGTVKVPG